MEEQLTLNQPVLGSSPRRLTIGGWGLFGEKDSLATVYAATHPHLVEVMNQPDSVVIKIEVDDYIVAGFDIAQRAHLSG